MSARSDSDTIQCSKVRAVSSNAAGKTSMAVEFRDVTLSFASSPHEPVLKNVTLSVPRGQFLVLVGPSGCGKTTLLNTAHGFCAPDHGDVLVLGGEPLKVRHRVGFMYARDALMPWRTVLRNAEIGLVIQGMPRRERRHVVLEHLKRLGLSAAHNKYPSQLSQGMRQRAALARTWAPNPEVILMDEPFAALDAQTRRVVQNVFLEMWERDKKSVLFVTHDLREAVALGDRVVIMRSGEIVKDVSIPFERPRDLASIGADQRFNEMVSELQNELKG